MDRLQFTLLFFFLLLQKSWASYRPVLKKKEDPKIRVLVAKSLKSVSINGMDLHRVLHLNNNKKTFEGRKRIRFNCYSYVKNKQNKSDKSIKLASLSSPTGLVSLKEHKYKGELHVVTSLENDSCDVINEVGLEEYISSLLSKEMSSSWELEALKAQAVAARTYAIAKMNHTEVRKQLDRNFIHYDLESSEKDQVSGTFKDMTIRTDGAARGTKGMVLMGGNGKIEPIFFHAKCGGRTLRPEQVWERAVQEYTNVACPFCINDSHHNKGWENKISMQRMRNFLKWMQKNHFLRGKLRLTPNANILIAPDKLSYFKLRIYVDDQIFVINKSLLRRYFGRVLFKSNNYKIGFQNNYFVVNGHGKGHGVGMCQLGALDLAKKGWSYKKILAHYFPHHKLVRYY